MTVKDTATKALAYLHSEGIYHGRMSFTNINVHESKRTNLWHTTHKLPHYFWACSHGLMEPRWVVCSSWRPAYRRSWTWLPILLNGVDWAHYSNLSPKLLAPKISLLLSDSSRSVNSTSTEQFWPDRTNAFFAAEVLFRLQYGPEADLWALGCAFYEARSGEIPFNLNGQNEPAEVVVAIVCTIGKPPKGLAWNQVRWVRPGILWRKCMGGLWWETRKSFDGDDSRNQTL